MKSMAWLAQCAILLAVLACADEAGSAGNVLSRGLKVFVTERTHGSDFEHDPTLAGTNAIQKADEFCNADPKKRGGSYRALIVDGGGLRDAKTLTNWVLQPSTTYYRMYGDVEIGRTTAAAIFPAVYTPLTNGIDPAPASPYMDSWVFVWTGIGDATDFSAGAACDGWSSFNGGGMNGVSHFTNGSAFSYGTMVCAGAQLHLYCVEQP
jgi:hypothetical protein